MTFSGEATSKQGRRLRFGLLTVLTNIRSTKVLWYVEDDLWWKTTFSGRWDLVEDNLWWKRTFSGRQHLVEDDLRRKTTFDGRRLSEDHACCVLRFAAFFQWRTKILQVGQKLEFDTEHHVLSSLDAYVYYYCTHLVQTSFIAKLSQAKPQLQLSWLALASLNFT